jgi:flagellin
MTRINTNVSSLRAINSLSSNQSSLDTSLTRLSTGLRINTAADDPSGLIASETLRTEMAGIEAAVENSERANNVIATAEGALNEVSALLVQLQSLITSSANDGALSEDEIEANQAEIDSILESIDRISNTTEFNGKSLLDGSLEYTLSGVDTSVLNSVDVYSADVPDDADLNVTLQVKTAAQAAELVYTSGPTGSADSLSLQISGNEGTSVVTIDGSATVAAIASAINVYTANTGVSASLSGTAIVFNSKTYTDDSFVTVTSIGTTDFKTKAAGGTAATSSTDKGSDADVYVNGQKATVEGEQVTLRNSTLDVSVLMDTSFSTAIGSTSFAITGGGANFQLSSTVSSSGQASLSLASVSTGSLGNGAVGYLSSIGSNGANNVTDKAEIAQEIVEAAILQVSSMRARLGAFQSNVLDTNINSQEVALENVTSSESAIRDADFAEETSNMTRAQILVSATTTVLKTANSNPQNVLSLLS